MIALRFGVILNKLLLSNMIGITAIMATFRIGIMQRILKDTRSKEDEMSMDTLKVIAMITILCFLSLSLGIVSEGWALSVFTVGIILFILCCILSLAADTVIKSSVEILDKLAEDWFKTIGKWFKE